MVDPNGAGIPEDCTWRLEDLYPSRADWERELDGLLVELTELPGFQGTLGQGGEALAACLKARSRVTRIWYKLQSYAARSYHLNLSIPENQEIHDRIGKVGTRMEAAMAFIEPEILLIAEEDLRAWSRLPELADFSSYLHDVARRRAHCRSQEVEAVIARSGDMASGPGRVYETLSTVNLPYPELVLDDGERVRLDQAAYSTLRYSRDRELRYRVFQSFWTAIGGFRETFAGLLANKVNVDHFAALVRGYDSDLDAALDQTDVPTGIYHNMILQIRRGLPLLHRYLRVRARILGLEQLAFHDLYVSMVPDNRFRFTWTQARELLLEALGVLGKEYHQVLAEGLASRWADVYPARNKRTGAYSSGAAYDTHPFVLLNYTDDYNALSTAAHEFGHAMHSHLSSSNQPYPKAGYPIFIAEVASTVNEILLRLHLSGVTDSSEMELFLLGQALESFRTTVFRQAMFAEFELLIHDLVGEGRALTAETLDRAYLGLLRDYYGEGEGVVRVDPLYAVEWAFVPHFYYNFYMFQYTTSFIAATTIADRIFQPDTREEARLSYLDMLKAGGSLPPVKLLAKAGLDMSGVEPYDAAFAAMEGILNRIEELIRDRDPLKD